MTSMREIIRAFWSSSARICSIALSSSAISALSRSFLRFCASIIELTAKCASSGDQRGEADGRADPDQELFPAPLAECLPPGQ